MKIVEYGVAFLLFNVMYWFGYWRGKNKGGK